MTRFWRAVAKFAAKRAGLQVIKDVQIGSTVIWPATTSTNATNVNVTWTRS